MPRRAEVGRGPLINKDSCVPLAVSDLPMKFVRCEPDHFSIIAISP
jgi:hypothetical protein